MQWWLDSWPEVPKRLSLKFPASTSHNTDKLPYSAYQHIQVHSTSIYKTTENTPPPTDLEQLLKTAPVARVQSVVYSYVSLPLHLFAYFGINTECSLSLI